MTRRFRAPVGRGRARSGGTRGREPRPGRAHRRAGLVGRGQRRRDLTSGKPRRRTGFEGAGTGNNGPMPATRPALPSRYATPELIAYGGHGGGLPGDRRDARADRRREGALRALRQGRRVPRPLPARGADRREPLGRGERDRDPRRGGDAGRPAVHRDGVRPRRDGRRPAARGPRRLRAGAALARAGGGGTRPGARPRDRPSRREARQPARRRRRHDPRLRLRHRPRGRERHPDRSPGPCSARPATWRRSRRAASRPRPPATGTRWPASRSSS